MIIVFAGTTEGRQLAERLGAAKKEALICVATEYGAQLLDALGGLPASVQVHTGRLEETAMAALLSKEQPELVVDATHPYAVLATENIQKACRETGVRYLRVLRQSEQKTLEKLTEKDGIIECSQMKEALQYLSKTEGSIFLTTGSKELKELSAFPGLAGRCTARVLPTEAARQACIDAQIPEENIIAAKGPFSYEQNREQLKRGQARYMVTKESGKAGGFDEKIRAARELGVITLVIRRPRQEDGVTVEEAWREIDQI